MNSLIDKINSYHVILASQSPRRKALLNQLGIKFIVKTADIDEDNHNFPHDPVEMVKFLSIEKGKVIHQQFPESLIIAADTTVALKGQILNKPTDENHAYKMLSLLSGNTHKVYTGYSIYIPNKSKWITEVVETEVTFNELTDEEIWAYIKSGSPMDKAGSYGIQDDFGAVFIRNISGDFYTVVGFPIQHFYQTMKAVFKVMGNP